MTIILPTRTLRPRSFPLIVSLAVSAAITAQVYAQDTNAPTVLKPTVVTGSLIPTAETVGAAPVETVSAADIQRIAPTDVLDLLKRVSPSFAGNGNFGQTVNNGGFGEAYVQLRNLPTLVMLNGRRLGNSSFSANAFGSQQVDINTIPLAMIERVEVLKDGSSALYGSSAIGGVINIITKSDFTATEIGGRWGLATGKGDYTEYRASVVSGVTTENASFMAGISYYFNDPLLTKDRSIASMGTEERNAKNLAPASYISPSFPGKVQAGGKAYFVAGSPFLAGQPGYNPNLSTPPVFPGVSFTGSSAVDDYNAYAIAHGYVDPTGNGLGPYVQATAAPLLNTTLFGTHSIQSQDRRQAFASGSYDLFGKEVQLFGQFLYANTESVGALAPSPVISLFDSRIFVPAENVYNPFQADLGPVGGASTPRIRSRFVQSGNRIFDAQTDFYHFVGGIKGEFENGYDYNVAYTYNRSDQVQFTKNAINGAALDLALRPNPDPALAAAGISSLQSSSGDFVPMYNIFFTPTAPFPTTTGPNDPSTIRALTTTLFQTGVSDEWDADALIRGQPFDLPGGKLAFAVGGGFRSESLSIDLDGLTRIGKVPGLNAQDPTSGRRDSWGVLAEVRIPITSPDQNIPGLHSLEITAAGRYENITAIGHTSKDSAVPKVSVRWQPLDEQFTLRGSYSQSFLTPDVYRLFGGAAVNNPFIFTEADGSFAQEQTVNLSNPGLEPVDAESWGAGIVISPKITPGLTLSVDYYHIQTENDIFRFSSQAMVNDLEANGPASPFVNAFRFDDGSRVTAPHQITAANWGTMNVPLGNGSEIETEGLDVAANYELPLDRDAFGRINLYASANILFKFEYKDPLIGGPFPYEGQYTDAANGIGGAQGLLPDWQLNLGLTWDFHDFTYSVNARYIPEVDDRGTLHQSNLGFENTIDDGLNDFTLDGSKWTVDSWYSIDMQLAYNFRRESYPHWLQGLRLAIGCNNVTDEDPPIIASSFEDNTDKSSYDILGRFIYFEITKKF